MQETGYFTQREKNLNDLLILLFYVYIALLPFENITHVIWNWDTPFRPYRLLALGIGCIILLSRPIRFVKLERNDLKLTAVYLLGLVPSMIAWTQDRFELNYFLLTSMQWFVILWIFLLVKNLPFKRQDVLNGLHIFSVATVANCVFMVSVFIWEDLGRQSGMMDNPNFAAFAANIAWVWFLYALFYSKRSFLHPVSIIYFACLLIVLAGIFVSGSRGALLSLLVSCVLFIMYGFRLKKLLVFIALLCILLIAASRVQIISDTLKIIPLWNRLESLTGREEARTTLWKQGWIAFQDRGFMGLGIEQFKNPDNYQRYVQTTENMSVVTQSGLVLHNDFLTILFEFGPFAFFVFLSFYFKLWSDIWAMSSGPIKLLFLALFLNVLLFALLDTTFQSHAVWLTLILITLGCKLSRGSENA